MKLNTKKVIVIATLLFLVLGIVILTIFNRHEMKVGEQSMSRRHDQIPENPDPEDIVGLSSVKLSANEEKEIKEIIKKEYNGQWKYCRTGDDSEIEEELYLPDIYQLFKQEIEVETEFEFDKRCREERDITQKEMDYFSKNIKFSKFRKYRDLDDRVGVIVSFGGIYYAPFIKESQNKAPFSFDIGIITSYGKSNYFLFKKVNNQWKIERKLFPTMKHFFNEASTIQQLLEQKNNETPEMEITES